MASAAPGLHVGAHPCRGRRPPPVVARAEPADSRRLDRAGREPGLSVLGLARHGGAHGDPVCMVAGHSRHGDVDFGQTRFAGHVLRPRHAGGGLLAAGSKPTGRASRRHRRAGAAGHLVEGKRLCPAAALDGALHRPATVASGRSLAGATRVARHRWRADGGLPRRAAAAVRLDSRRVRCAAQSPPAGVGTAHGRSRLHEHRAPRRRRRRRGSSPGRTSSRSFQRCHVSGVMRTRSSATSTRCRSGTSRQPGSSA